MQIYALARDYRLKINLGQNPADPAVASLLDYAAYAADNFYGIEAYHYAAPGTDNVRTKERINTISGWSAQYQTNSTQIAYYQSSIVAGLARTRPRVRSLRSRRQSDAHVHLPERHEVRRLLVHWQQHVAAGHVRRRRPRSPARSAAAEPSSTASV